jgi:hypothetical protein
MTGRESNVAMVVRRDSAVVVGGVVNCGRRGGRQVRNNTGVGISALKEE